MYWLPPIRRKAWKGRKIQRFPVSSSFGRPGPGTCPPLVRIPCPGICPAGLLSRWLSPFCPGSLPFLPIESFARSITARPSTGFPLSAGRYNRITGPAPLRSCIPSGFLARCFPCFRWIIRNRAAAFLQVAPEGKKIQRLPAFLPEVLPWYSSGSLYPLPGGSFLLPWLSIVLVSCPATYPEGNSCTLSRLPAIRRKSCPL